MRGARAALFSTLRQYERHLPMREGPSPELIELVEELGLADRTQLRAAGRRARALARDLPLFDSVWIDALVQLRCVTPYQAQEINAGRGRDLRVGDYLLCEPLADLGYAQRFAAREIATRRPVCLDLMERSQVELDLAERRLTTLAEQLHRSSEPDKTPAITDHGREADRLWVAGPASVGISAAEWIVRNGRFPPQAVLEIARQLVAELVRLEAAGLLHGDVSADNLVLESAGEVHLSMPGLRPIVRPEEGHTHAELPPAAYDYLAPERISDGTPPTRASDLYAVGCLCAHLLTGRPPLPGGNSLAKLKSAQAAKIIDVRRLAPETPAPLAAAISACTQREPSRRPATMAQLAATLGPSTREGRRMLAECLLRRAPRQSALVMATELVRRSRHTPVWLSAAAGSLLMLATVTWPLWRPAVVTPLATLWRSEAETEIPPPAELPTNDSARAIGQADVPHESRPMLPADAQLVSATLPAASATGDLILPSDRIVRAEELRLAPRQTVRAAPGERARVYVSDRSLLVEVEGVRFEQIDFVGAQPAPAPGERIQRLAMLDVAAAEVEFHGCSFQPLKPGDNRWVAIKWSGSRAADSAPSRLNLADCVLREVRVGVECLLAGAVLIDCDNTLHLGSGPLWRLHRVPAVDAPVAFSLRGCTIRGASSLLDVTAREVPEESGRISIEAISCVLAPESQPHAAVVRLAASDRLDLLLQALDWRGQGSLLGHNAPLVASYNATGERHAVDDRLITIDGLVRADFEFAAATMTYPTDNEIIRWAAPIRSDAPPGIRATPLHLPVLAGVQQAVTQPAVTPRH